MQLQVLEGNHERCKHQQNRAWRKGEKSTLQTGKGNRETRPKRTKKVSKCSCRAKSSRYDGVVCEIGRTWSVECDRKLHERKALSRSQSPDRWSHWHTFSKWGRCHFPHQSKHFRPSNNAPTARFGHWQKPQIHLKSRRSTVWCESWDSGRCTVRDLRLCLKAKWTRNSNNEWSSTCARGSKEAVPVGYES